MLFAEELVVRCQDGQGCQSLAMEILGCWGCLAGSQNEVVGDMVVPGMAVAGFWRYFLHERTTINALHFPPETLV